MFQLDMAEWIPTYFVIASNTWVLLEISASLHRRKAEAGRFSSRKTPSHSILQPGLWSSQLRDQEPRMQCGTCLPAVQKQSLWLVSRRICISSRFPCCRQLPCALSYRPTKKWIYDKCSVALMCWAGSQDTTLCLTFSSYLTGITICVLHITAVWTKAHMWAPEATVGRRCCIHVPGALISQVSEQADLWDRIPPSLLLPCICYLVCSHPVPCKHRWGKPSYLKWGNTLVCRNT